MRAQLSGLASSDCKHMRPRVWPAGGDGSRRRQAEAEALEDRASTLEAQQAERAAQVQIYTD